MTLAAIDLPARTVLYRLDATDGTLLYVGITEHPKARFKAHAKAAGWWPLVDHARTRFDWFDTREAASVAELSAIYGERPIHNVVGRFRDRPPGRPKCAPPRNPGWRTPGRRKYTPPNEAVAAEIDAAVDLHRLRRQLNEQRRRAQLKLKDEGGVELAILLYRQRLDVDLKLLQVLPRLTDELGVTVSYLAVRFGVSRKEVYRLAGRWMP